jgi:predicted metal-dependent peptidase
MFTEDNLISLRRDVQQRIPATQEFFDIVPFKIIDEHSPAGVRDIPTACVNADGVFFNKEFMESLPLPKQRGVVLHEIMHMSQADISSPYVDTTVTPETFAQWSNIAQDIANDGVVWEQYVKGFPSPFLEQYLKLEILKPYLGWSWIDIYKDLKSKAIAEGRMLSASDGDGMHVDEPGQSSPTMQKDIQRAQKVAKAREMGASAGDQHKIGQEEVTPEAAKVDWRRLVRHILTTVNKPHYPTYSRPARRGIARGATLPTVVGVQRGIKHVNLWVDVSGSMCHTLPQVVGDMMALFTTLSIPTATIRFYDTELCSVREVNNDTPLSHLKLIPHGGGTSFIRSYVQAMHKKMTPGPNIILTDGEDDFILPDKLLAHMATKTKTSIIIGYGRGVHTNFGVVTQYDLD